MGLFNFMKGDPSGLSGSDKLMVLGAMLKDFGAGGQTNNVGELSQLLQGRRDKAAKEAEKAAALASLSGLFGGPTAAPAAIPEPQSAGDYRAGLVSPSVAAVPQMPQAQGARAPMSYSDPRLPQIALQAKMAGIDPSVAVDWLRNTGEQRYEEGVRYSPYGGNNPAFIPKRMDGAMTTFGPDGPRMTPIAGAREIAADTAGAVAGAQEGAQSAYDIIQVPQRDGTMRSMTRFQAAQMLGGQGGPLPGGFGVQQSPGERAYDEGSGRAKAEIATMPAKAATEASIDLPSITSQATQTISVIDALLANPALDKRTGAFSLLPAIPGSAGAGFDALHDQLQGKVFLEAFTTLKGGGQITEKEGKAAQAAFARLNRSQSPEDYRAALTELRAIVSTGLERAQQKALGGSRPSAANRPSTEELMQEARKRGLIR